MFAVQLAVAQSAQEPSAAMARENGFPGGMVKASRFAFDQNDFTAHGRSSPPKQSWKDFDLQQALTSGARLQPRLIERGLHQRRSAPGTFHGQYGHRLFQNHAGIANAIVQGAP